MSQIVRKFTDNGKHGSKKVTFTKEMLQLAGMSKEDFVNVTISNKKIVLEVIPK